MLVPMVVDQTSHGERAYDIFSRSAQGPHRFPRFAGRRHGFQPRHRPDALPAGGGSGARHLPVPEHPGRRASRPVLRFTIRCNTLQMMWLRSAWARRRAWARSCWRPGAKGKRSALRNSRVMIHQPLGGSSGQAAMLEIYTKEILKVRDSLYEILARHTGQDAKKIATDSDRDFFMSADEAKAVRPRGRGARESRRASSEEEGLGPHEAPAERSPQMIKCSFCARGQDEVAKLVAGPNSVYICNECIELCNDILEGELLDEATLSPPQFPKPVEIKDYLDQYVDRAGATPRRSLAVAVYNHYKRDPLSKPDADGVEIDKSNILLHRAARARGKTLLAQTLARFLDVPFAIADATTLTEAGYVGEDVENILLRLLQAADYNIPARRAGHRLHRRDRQDRAARASNVRPSRATCRARACSRRCSRSSRAPSPTCRRRAGASIPQQKYLQVNTAQHPVRLRRRVRRARQDRRPTHRQGRPRLRS